MKCRSIGRSNRCESANSAGGGRTDVTQVDKGFGVELTHKCFGASSLFGRVVFRCRWTRKCHKVFCALCRAQQQKRFGEAKQRECLQLESCSKSAQERYEQAGCDCDNALKLHCRKRRQKRFRKGASKRFVGWCLAYA